MNISPDSIIIMHWGFFPINATILNTWIVMLLLAGSSWLITRRLSSGPDMSRWQNILEVLVTGLSDQISAVSRRDATPYLPFIGTLFIFVLAANLLVIVPGYRPPTGSLSTTTALAICVFFAVPVFGIVQQGALNYFKLYLKPSPLMLPFNLIGEVSRTIALSVRLYGNVMSGTVIAAILLTLVPFFFPVVMQLLSLITGAIQAYILAILATVYIASATVAKKSDTSMVSNKLLPSELNEKTNGDASGKP